MSQERRSQVLRAIVEDYVSTQEPVGSKTLVDRHSLGVSPATIRNDMALLEQEGLIAQPHTSAGRIPTDKGYREFVDRIDEVKPLSGAERRAIDAVMRGTADVDEILDRSVRLLAQLTHQVAVVQYPLQVRATVRHIELVALAPQRLLVVMITDSGRVEQRLLTHSWDQASNEETLATVKAAVNRAFTGAGLDAIAGLVPGLATTVAPPLVPLATAIGETVAELAGVSRGSRVMMAGTANLARSGSDFGEAIWPLLEAFEEQVVLLKLLHSMARDDADVTVRIGAENTHQTFTTASVVSTGYVPGSRIAVLGPTRMDYPTTIAAVRAVARYVSVILADNGD